MKNKADKIIYNIGQLVTSRELDDTKKMDNIEILENAYIAIKEDKIIKVACGEIDENLISNTTEMISAENKLVTPGLIDSHTHLIHGGSRENEFAMKIEGVPYLEILAKGGGILSTLKSTREASLTDLIEQAKESLKHMLEFGVTTVEAKSGYGLNLKDELKQLEAVKILNYLQPVTLISTFMAAHATPPEFKDNKKAYIDEVLKMLPIVKDLNLAEFCDIFCEKNVFSKEESKIILSKAKELGFKLKIHADEIESIGGVDLAAELHAISSEHLMKITDSGMDELKKSGVIANLLPATSFNLREEYAPARKMIAKGIELALSTDYNPGSCPSENLQFVMHLAAAHMKLTPKEVFKGVTINAAKAICKQDEIGSIEVGKKADIVIFNAKNINYFLYHFGINHTYKVFKNGELVFERK